MLFKYSLFLILVLKCVNSAKILAIFWTPIEGHHLAGIKHLQALAKRGHTVDLLSTYKNKVDIPTYNQTHLHGIVGPHMPLHYILGPLNLPITLGEKAENFWKNNKVKEIVRERPHYDVVIILAYYTDHIYPIARHLTGSPPLILFVPHSTHYMEHKYVGLSNLPYYTHPSHISNPTTFIDRLWFVFYNMVFFVFDKYIWTRTHERITRNYIPDALPLSKLNVSLMLVNTHIALETPRPYLPNMIQIGGFDQPKSESIDEDCREFLDSDQRKTVLLSFGTIYDIDQRFASIPDLVVFLSGFRDFKFLVKSRYKYPFPPENILVVDWIQSQANVLAHPNVILFVTHGGYDGVMEAIYHGKPILGIPLTEKDEKFVNFAVDNGFGVKIAGRFVSDDTISEILNSTISNASVFSSLKKNALQRSLLLKNQPINPVDHACWWVEHIIEHKGGEHLKNVAIDLNWYELYMLDVVFILVLFFTLTFLYCIWIKILTQNDEESD